jgi:hypothetical protein
LGQAAHRATVLVRARHAELFARASAIRCSHGAAIIFSGHIAALLHSSAERLVGFWDTGADVIVADFIGFRIALTAGDIYGFAEAVGVFDGAAVRACVIADRGFVHTYARARILNAFRALGTLAAVCWGAFNVDGSALGTGCFARLRIRRRLTRVGLRALELLVASSAIKGPAFSTIIDTFDLRALCLNALAKFFGTFGHTFIRVSYRHIAGILAHIRSISGIIIGLWRWG